MRFLFVRFRFCFPVLDFLQARFEPRLHALFGGSVIFPAEQAVRQTLHIRKLVRGVVRILIALAVFELLHKLSGCVAYDERHGLGKHIHGVPLRRTVRRVQRV